MAFKMKGWSAFSNEDTSALKLFRQHPTKEFDKNFHSLSDSKTPIFRKNLDKGVLGEANNDGTIFVDKSVPEGSPLEAEVEAHEKRHLDDMNKKVKSKPGAKRKVKKLGYTDNTVTWKGKKYLRKDGNIIDPKTGESHPEGWKGFPWEQEAYKAGERARKKVEDKIK